MTAPTPHDTRLFDAGAHWATEPTDRRGYGDALRDAVERATTPGDRDRGRELAHLARRVESLLGNLDSADAHEDAEAVADRLRALAATPPAPEGEAVRLTEACDLLDTVLGQFRHKGHPGVPSLQTGWVRTDQVEAWQARARDLRLAGADQPAPTDPKAEGKAATERAQHGRTRDLVAAALGHLTGPGIEFVPEKLAAEVRDLRAMAPAPAGPQAEGAGDPYGLDPYGTGDGSYPEPDGGGSS